MPPAPPDPEQTQWYWAVIGALGMLVGWLGRNLWGRQQKQVDEHERDFKELATANSRALSEHATRLAVIESRKLVTLDDLRIVVDNALDRVEGKFSKEHDRLGIEMATTVKASRAETTEMIAECNSHLRTDIDAMSLRMAELAGNVNSLIKTVSSLTETVGRILDDRGTGRRRKR